MSARSATHTGSDGTLDHSGPVRGASDTIRRIGVVSHNYNIFDNRGLYDYSEHFSDINKLCDEQGCDTILYALYTWDRNSTTDRDPAACFAHLSRVRTIILELGQPEIESFDHVEILQAGQPKPAIVRQRFAASGDAGERKSAFIDELEERRIGDALLVLCGETNIASTQRGTDEFYDPYDFSGHLKRMGIRLILNPVHDYMRRYEMRLKRCHFSRDGITVISVWNQGKGRESKSPWTVFRNGEEATDAIRELASPFSDRPDIRIGIVDLD